MLIENLTLNGGLTFTTISSPPVITGGLVVQLRPDSYPGTGTIWYDTEGHANGTIYNNPTYSSTGFTFTPSSDQYIRLPSNSFTDYSGYSNYSIEVWFKAINNTPQALKYIVKKHRYTDATIKYPYDIMWNSGINTVFIAANGGQYAVGASNTMSGVSDGVWNQIVGVFDWAGRTCKIYNNGNQGVEFPGSVEGCPPGSVSSEVTVELGNDSSDFGIVHAFNGSIGIFRIYNKALSTYEVQQNFGADRGIFGI